MPTAQLHDVRLHYDLHGDGPPVLFIMGLAVPGMGWRPQVEVLRDRFTCLTFDNRGVGDSEVTRGAYTTKQMALDALGLMDTVGWRRAHVVGISMGGMIAQELALLAPGRVRTLTLLATHGGGRKLLPPLRTLKNFFDLQRSKDPERRLALFNRLLFTPAFVDQHRERLREGMAADLAFKPQPVQGFRGQFAACASHRTGKRLGQLRGIPTLVATGAVDQCVSPVNARLLGRWMPWARVVEIPGCAHGINVMAHAEVNRLLHELFEAHP